MRIIDANIFLYAYHPASPYHERCRRWLEIALSGVEPVGLAWMTVFAFLRIVTSPRIFDHPLTMAEAQEAVSAWFAQPAVVALEAGERYWTIFSTLLRDAQVSGPLVMDAALAALAVEHGATVCSTDRDFLRFPGVTVLNPLADT